MNKCSFDKYKRSGAVHWTAISKNIKNHGLGFEARYRTCVRLLRHLLQSDKTQTILDLGCGDGTLFYFLNRAFPNASLHGIDGSRDGIELAKTYFARHSVSNVELKTLDFSDLDSIKAKYDIVISLDVIEHLQDHDRFLASISSLLNDGGYILLSTPIRITEFPRDKDHKREFFPNEFKGLIEKNGFEVITHDQITPIYYLIRYFHPIRFGIGKSKLYKTFYNLLNICFKYNVFLKKAPAGSYELYETQFVLARKKT